MGEAKIAAILKDGRIVTRSSLENVAGPELAELILHLELIKQDLEKMYRDRYMKSNHGKG